MFSNLVKNDKYRRYSMRSKVSYDVWDWLTLSNNTSYVVTERKKPSYYNISSFFDLEPHDMDRNPDWHVGQRRIGRSFGSVGWTVARRRLLTDACRAPSPAS